MSSYKCSARLEEQSDQEVRLLVPPNQIVEEMICDMGRVAYGRGMYFFFFLNMYYSSNQIF